MSDICVCGSCSDKKTRNGDSVQFLSVVFYYLSKFLII